MLESRNLIIKGRLNCAATRSSSQSLPVSLRNLFESSCYAILQNKNTNERNKSIVLYHLHANHRFNPVYRRFPFDFDHKNCTVFGVRCIDALAVNSKLSIKLGKAEEKT